MITEFKIAVIKFGSSVLSTVSEIPNAIHETYQYLREGYKVVVVVSAIGKTTNDLIAKSQLIIDDYSGELSSSPAFAELLASGEIVSSSLFTLALARAGIPAHQLNPNILRTKGSIADSEPFALQTELILSLFKQYSVLVIPGFIGTNQENLTTLLGRGGSDFSALFIAWTLQAERCVLYKDTKGIFNQNPKMTKTALPYHTISYEDCLKIPYPVLQHKALRFAQSKKFSFIVKALTSLEETLVGNEPSSWRIPLNIRKLKVILLGLGTVGFGVYQYLLENNPLFEIVGIGVKDLKKHQHRYLSKEIISDNLQALVARECDVVIELIGGTELSKELITQALLRKRHVITANKALIAAYGQQLLRIATRSQVQLLFSAAVGGSIPVLELLNSYQKQNPTSPVVSISAILNGTSNFILDKIREGKSFEQAIKLAQIAGFAEADPSLDITGIDSAEKLKIISQFVFHQEPKDIKIEGIQNIKEEFIHNEVDKNNTVRLVASGELKNNKVYARVEPVSLPHHHLLANITDANNCILLVTADGTTIQLCGKGAGRWPTAEAVYADLIDLFLNQQNKVLKPKQENKLLFNKIRESLHEPLDAISAF